MAERHAPRSLGDLTEGLLPAASPRPDLDPGRLQAAVRSGHPVLVLDDDPTGTQALADTEVELDWDPDKAVEQLAGARLAYVITNSRSVDAASATAIASTITADLRARGVGPGRLTVISRSDSTLRGHFPVEVDALRRGLGDDSARVLLLPFFGDARRITLRGVHYVGDGDMYTEVAATEYALDSAFGFRASRLSDWIAERAGGDRPVMELDLLRLRSAGPPAVADALRALPPGGVLVPDATADADAETIAMGAMMAESAGVSVVARTASSYVRARLAMPRPGLVDLRSMGGGPGLVVVGSHTSLADRQLGRLVAIAGPRLTFVEVDVAALADGRAGLEVDRAARRIDESFAAGRHAVLATSRRVIRAGGAGDDLALGRRVSQSLSGVVSALRRRPAWIVAKGGITSYDVARTGLGMRRARVLGPARPGVPVWTSVAVDPVSKPSGSGAAGPYVVVPGNVGDDDTISDLFGDLAS